MSWERAGRLAWIAPALTVRARPARWAFGPWVLLATTASVLHVAQDDLWGATLAPVLLAFAAVGTVIADQRQQNPIGWIMLAVALLISVSGVAEGIYFDPLVDRVHPSSRTF